MSRGGSRAAAPRRAGHRLGPWARSSPRLPGGVRAPRRLQLLSEESGARAAGAGLRRDAGSPLWLPPLEGRCCRGSCTARGEGRRGRGGARAPALPRSQPRAGGEGACPSAESSGAGAQREAASLEGQPSGASARLGGKLQARPGRGNAGRSAGKSEPGKERTRGVGARSAGSARAGGDRGDEPKPPPEGGEAGDGRRFWGWS